MLRPTLRTTPGSISPGSFFQLPPHASYRSVFSQASRRGVVSSLSKCPDLKEERSKQLQHVAIEFKKGETADERRSSDVLSSYDDGKLDGLGSGLRLSRTFLSQKQREILVSRVALTVIGTVAALRNTTMEITCSTEGQGQTQTIKNETILTNKAPLQSKEKSPQLDDGGTGLPPRDGDGGGGGGGGGGGWGGGGFVFWALILLLGFFRDKELDSPFVASSMKQRRKQRRQFT